MVIQPKYAPELFLAKFGRIDEHINIHNDDTQFIQRCCAEAWDAAILHVMFEKPIQQPVLTHPAVQSCTHQPKGD